MNKTARWTVAGRAETAPANPYPVPVTRGDLIVPLWSIVLLLSALPDIIWIELLGTIPTWLPLAKMGLLLALGLMTLLWERPRPLRPFFIVMFVFLALSSLRPLFNFTFAPLQVVFGNTVFDERMQAEQTGKLSVSLLMIVTLLLLGYRRRDFFLTRGFPRAAIDPVPLLGFPKADPWPRFGLQWGFYIAFALAAMQYLLLRPGGEVLLQIIPILPSIVFYAALNAFNEEVTYRAPILATLEPLSGSKQALWLSAYFFGIAHYFGTPGGLLGALLSIFMGWILGKAMLETRGLVWAWWIHFLSDIVIFTFLTVSLLS